MKIILAPPPTTGVLRGEIFLPLIATAPIDQIEQFYHFLSGDLRQRRPILSRSSVLESAALWKATDLLTSGLWSHCASNGEWPNKTVRRFGFALPNTYGDDWNGVESLAAGSADALSIFTALSNSPHHRVHLFGENDFYLRQDMVGVAVAARGEQDWVWCILIAEGSRE